MVEAIFLKNIKNFIKYLQNIDWLTNTCQGWKQYRERSIKVNKLKQRKQKLNLEIFLIVFTGLWKILKIDGIKFLIGLTSWTYLDSPQETWKIRK